MPPSMFGEVFSSSLPGARDLGFSPVVSVHRLAGFESDTFVLSSLPSSSGGPLGLSEVGQHVLPLFLPKAGLPGFSRALVPSRGILELTHRSDIFLVPQHLKGVLKIFGLQGLQAPAQFHGMVPWTRPRSSFAATSLAPLMSAFWLLQSLPNSLNSFPRIHTTKWWG